VGRKCIRDGVRGFSDNHRMISARERFLAVVSTGPLLRADAVIVLTGEDGKARTEIGAQLMRQEGADYVVLSGGVDKPPRCLSAKTLEPVLMGMGVSPTRIILEPDSMNTREQAVNVTALAIEKGWKRLLLVASPYHSCRAFLTFLKAIEEAGKADEIQLVNVPASQLKWFGKPAGVDHSRADLFAGELGKIALYGEHVASYESGLKYLERWEAA
jgi:uncharacterized SAM-binding protein YcdF (DUF218 family)